MSTLSDSLHSRTSRPYDAARWSWLTVLFHALGVVLIQSTQNAAFFIVPVLAKRRFGASDWQAVLVTAAPTVLIVTGIFWNDIFRRSRLGRYLVIFWLVVAAPLCLAPLVSNFWQMLALHIAVCVGIAGYHPAAGELLKHLYPDAIRGRLFGFLSGANMLVTAAGGFGIGVLLDKDHDAFRWYMPVAAGLQGCGVLVFWTLAKRTGLVASRVIALRDAGLGRLAALLAPIAHMRDVLRGDRVFYRYEAAYMTYGVGWMICAALLPLIVTNKLHLDYETVAESTHVAYLVALVAVLAPCGMMMDRLGAARTSGISFAALALYPLGLMLARDSTELAIVSVIYGIAHSGTHLGWTLGPVSLAPSSAKVPQYVAIHATLVGLRGAVFQGLGWAIYRVTGSFTWPLVLAVGAFVWASWQMMGLAGAIAGRMAGAGGKAAPEGESDPPAEEVLGERG